MRSLRQLAKDLEGVSELAATLALELREIADQAASANPAQVFAMLAELLKPEGGDAVEPRPFGENEPDLLLSPGLPKFPQALSPNQSVQGLKRGDQIYRVRTARPLEEAEKEEVRNWWLSLQPTLDQLSEERILAMKKAQARKYNTTTKVISGIIGGISFLNKPRNPNQSPLPISTPITSPQSDTKRKVH